MNNIEILKVKLQPINDFTFGITECEEGYFVPFSVVDISTTIIKYRFYKFNMEIIVNYKFI